MNKIFGKIEEKYIISSMTDKNGIITDVSEAFCKISGYSKEELIGKSHSIIKHEDTPENTFIDLWTTIKQKKIWSGIIKNKNKNGQAYWVDSYIEPIIKNRECIGYLSLRFDVTDSYKLEKINKRLTNSLRNFERLFDSIDVGVAIVNNEGKYLQVNKYLTKLMGYKEEELLINNILANHMHVEKIKKLFSDFYNSLRPINEYEQKACITKTGKEIWVEVHYTYFCEDKMIITVRDVSEQKELEKTTKLLLKQSKDAEMGEMLSMIAHQWRQPITTISTILSKIGIKRELNMYKGSDLTKDTNRIGSIIDHLSSTIEFFRNYTKPKKGNHVLLKDVINTVSNIIEPLCENNSIYLEYNYQTQNDLIVDDRIDQVLLNLYKNALDAYTNKKRKGSIITEVKENSDYILIKVSDQAGGIEESKINKIFEPYYSTKSKNGTGLGLYMSKNIINDLVKGKFYCKNENDGLAFYIELAKVIKK